MTARQMYDFALGQIAYYERQIEFIEKHLGFCNRELARSRSEDRRIAKYAMETDGSDPLTARIFGGNYVSTDTRKLMNERAKYYRERKRSHARLAHYRKEAEFWERFIG